MIQKFIYIIFQFLNKEKREMDYWIPAMRKKSPFKSFSTIKMDFFYVHEFNEMKEA
jgi:hypothetical protein